MKNININYQNLINDEQDDEEKETKEKKKIRRPLIDRSRRSQKKMINSVQPSFLNTPTHNVPFSAKTRNHNQIERNSGEIVDDIIYENKPKKMHKRLWTAGAHTNMNSNVTHRQNRQLKLTNP